MRNLNRMHTNAVEYNRSTRVHKIEDITTLPAGRMVPISAIPLLREDALSSCAVRLGFEMGETVEMLMNKINIRVMAYFVPNLALERFGGSMDILNRSYMGEPAMDGGTVIPFVETHEYSRDIDVYRYLGMHAREDDLVNTAYLESYNAIWNMRAKNRSPDLELRDRLQGDLASAFWMHQALGNIVPDFDQAKIDGEVSLNVVNPQLNISGMYRGSSTGYPSDKYFHASLGGEAEPNVPRPLYTDSAGSAGSVFAELQENGITVSLANIELARKTQAFARLRERYAGVDEEWVLDMLMSGLSIPDQAWKQPMLMADKVHSFDMAKRYATDAGNLTESVVNGIGLVELRLRLPRVAVGGMVMVVAEITPDQLWERQKDPYFHATGVDAFPDALKDVLDPEKVQIVTNDYVDVDHETPDDLFGYAPLNFEWNRLAMHAGGDFFRPEVDAGFDEKRQRFWAAETANPVLGEDFMLANTLHTKPFVFSGVDPFEVVAVGGAMIKGNTQFGHELIEASDDYEKVLEKADQTRIEKVVEEETEE